VTIVTLPPEMLPSPAEGEEAEVIFLHPDTRKETILLITAEQEGTPHPLDWWPYDESPLPPSSIN
jgi:hypothetical protein